MHTIIPNPRFDSRLTELVFALERLRYYSLKGTTPKWLFFDLKAVMHMMESLASARIEGNRTTVMGMVEAVIQDNEATDDEQILEIAHIQDAILFIEQQIGLLDDPRSLVIDEAFIKELHRMSVEGLEREGSATPGEFRRIEVAIQKSDHVPPSHRLVPSMMKDLIDYIDSDNMPQHDLLKTAVVHHSLAWIHPFDNGNGRVTRLITYAMLAKQGFIDDKGFRILNPTAIFCSDRPKYYDMLAVADKGGDDGLDAWCEYVLAGIKSEVEKVDKLLNADFARTKIIRPALQLARDKKWVTGEEYEILLIAFDKGIIQARDISHLFGTTPSAKVQTSRVIARMKEQRYLMPHPDNPRKYVPRFSNNYLLRGVMQQLDINDMLPLKEEDNNG